jgi:hypothetical protein
LESSLVLIINLTSVLNHLALLAHIHIWDVCPLMEIFLLLSK